MNKIEKILISLFIRCLNKSDRNFEYKKIKLMNSIFKINIICFLLIVIMLSLISISFIWFFSVLIVSVIFLFLIPISLKMEFDYNYSKNKDIKNKPDELLNKNIEFFLLLLDNANKSDHLSIVNKMHFVFGNSDLYEVYKKEINQTNKSKEPFFFDDSKFKEINKINLIIKELMLRDIDYLNKSFINKDTLEKQIQNELSYLCIQEKILLSKIYKNENHNFFKFEKLKNSNYNFSPNKKEKNIKIKNI